MEQRFRLKLILPKLVLFISHREAWPWRLCSGIQERPDSGILCPPVILCPVVPGWSAGPNVYLVLPGRAPWCHSEILSLPLLPLRAERTVKDQVAHRQSLFPWWGVRLGLSNITDCEVGLGCPRMGFLHNLHSHVRLLLFVHKFLHPYLVICLLFPSPIPEVSAKIVYNLYHLPSC